MHSQPFSTANILRALSPDIEAEEGRGERAGGDGVRWGAVRVTVGISGDHYTCTGCALCAPEIAESAEQSRQGVPLHSD